MLRGWRHRQKLQKLADQCDQAALRDYLLGAGSLKPDTLANTPLIAVDLELTGLDVDEHQIISMGWTLIDQGRIAFASNRHQVVQAGHSVGDSATIHEMVDAEVAAGGKLESGLEKLFSAAVGRIWVFHHAPLDVGFLQRACMQWAGVAPPIACLDTMQIERTLRERRSRPLQPGDLQLSALRRHYHLPEYTAHNALLDAFATAELMLAIAARMEPGRPLKLTPWLRYL